MFSASPPTTDVRWLNRNDHFVPMGGVTLWISAERVAQFRALWPLAKIEPEIGVSSPQVIRAWSGDDALVEIIRGRLEGSGTIAAATLASSLGMTTNEVGAPLADAAQAAALNRSMQGLARAVSLDPDDKMGL